MSDTFGLVSFIIFIVTFASLFFNLLKIKNLNIKLKLQIIDLIQKNELLTKALESKESQQVEKTEGFLNFITQSRDWAFEYIEEVQSGLTKFVDEVGPLVDYFDEYGDNMGMLPNYEGMKKVSIAFKELKQLLPKDEE